MVTGALVLHYSRTLTRSLFSFLEETPANAAGLREKMIVGPVVVCVLDSKTKKTAVARVGRPYRVRPKTSVRLPVAEKKRLSSGDYGSIHAMFTQLSNATSNVSIHHGVRE